jgi:hypothetical protein
MMIFTVWTLSPILLQNNISSVRWWNIIVYKLICCHVDKENPIKVSYFINAKLKEIKHRLAFL